MADNKRNKKNNRNNNSDSDYNPKITKTLNK